MGQSQLGLMGIECIQLSAQHYRQLTGTSALVLT